MRVAPVGFKRIEENSKRLQSVTVYIPRVRP